MPDSGKQLIHRPDFAQLTEAEARLIGVSAQRLARYRNLLTKSERGGSVNVTPGAGQVFGENLGSLDIQAVLGLLIEREEVFLASYNVKIERPE